MATPYITTAELWAYLKIDPPLTNEYDSLCEALSNAFDAKLSRFEWRLFYHLEEVYLNTEKNRKVYNPKITPIKTIVAQKLYSRWQEIWNYDWYIYMYKDYIKLSDPLDSEPQHLYIKTESWFFDESSIDPLIKLFLLKYASQIIIQNQKAEAQVNWWSSWSETSFKVWNFSVDFENTSWEWVWILTEDAIWKYWLWLEFEVIQEKYWRNLWFNRF